MKKFAESNANPPARVSVSVSDDRVYLNVDGVAVVDIATWEDGERVGHAAHAAMRIYPKKLATALGLSPTVISVDNNE